MRGMVERASDAPPTSERPRYYAVWFVAAFYLIAVIWGVRHVDSRQPSILDVLVPAVMNLVLGWWAISDSLARECSIPVLTRQWFVIAAGVLVPCYLIWSRRWRGLGLVLLHAAAWFCLSMLVSVAGRFVAFVAF